MANVVMWNSERGFLTGYPDDVVYLVNGRAITKSDILDAKRERQRKRLARIRHNPEPVIKPCFIWVFHVDGFAYHGWHLYVKTLTRSWWIKPNWRYVGLVLKIMKMFPCGFSPDIDFFDSWKVAFAEAYKRTKDGAGPQGMVLARAEVSSGGNLLDVMMMSV